MERNQDCRFCKESINIWHFIDAAIVICLQDREDRFEEASIELHRTGLCQIAEFYRPIRDPRGFIVGCWDSQAKVCKMGLDKNYNIILSLEDDFELDPNKEPETIANELQSAMSNLPFSWKRLSLGNINWFQMYYTHNLDRAASILSHAQIWSVEGMKWMWKNNVDDRPEFAKSLSFMHVDGFVSARCSHSYTIKPMVAFQKDLSSDRQIHDTSVLRENVEASQYYIPVSLTIGFLLIFVVLCLFMVYICKFRFLPVFFILSSLMTVPFLILWGLVLADEI